MKPIRSVVRWWVVPTPLSLFIVDIVVEVVVVGDVNRKSAKPIRQWFSLEEPTSTVGGGDNDTRSLIRSRVAAPLKLTTSFGLTWRYKNITSKLLHC